jgi:hypothetical protein
MQRLVAAILLMTVTTQAWAEKVYNTPKAKACRAEAAEKFPMPADPSNASRLKSTENWPRYRANYRECMKRAD